MIFKNFLEDCFYMGFLPVLFVFIVAVFPISMAVSVIRAIKNRKKSKDTLTHKVVLFAVSILLAAAVLILPFFIDEYFAVGNAFLFVLGFEYWLVLAVAAVVFVVINKKTQLSKKKLSAVFCVETAVVLVCWELQGKFIQNLLRAVIPKLSTFFVTLFYTVVLIFGGNGQFAQSVQTDSAVFTASDGEVIIEVAMEDRGISFWSLSRPGELSPIEAYMPDLNEIENESSNRSRVTLHLPCNKFGVHEYELEFGSYAPGKKAYSMCIKFKVFVGFNSVCYVFETPTEEFDDLAEEPEKSEVTESGFPSVPAGYDNAQMSFAVPALVRKPDFSASA